MKNQIDRAMQRAQTYWQIDGLTEIAFAWICLILGVYFFISASVPKDTMISTLVDSSFILVFLGGGWLGLKLVNLIKQRAIYPRTGYVSYRKKKGANRWVAGGLAMFMGILVGGLMAAAPGSFAWMPAITGFLLSIPLLILGYKSGAWRFYLLCALSLLAGLSLSLAGIGNILGLSYYYLSECVALMISGVITFFRYLRLTAPLEDGSLQKTGQEFD